MNAWKLFSARWDSMGKNENPFVEERIIRMYKFHKESGFRTCTEIVRQMNLIRESSSETNGSISKVGTEDLEKLLKKLDDRLKRKMKGETISGPAWRAPTAKKYMFLAFYLSCACLEFSKEDKRYGTSTKLIKWKSRKIQGSGSGSKSGRGSEGFVEYYLQNFGCLSSFSKHERESLGVLAVKAITQILKIAMREKKKGSRFFDIWQNILDAINRVEIH
ncbi:MAG: hypothetical protein HYW48_07275 [Deltaproteobacteria bacterium]|nr:hypothetical protein [Deltaproteobacteria bacterium]